MAFKALLFLFASFLLLSPQALSSNEDQLLEGEFRSPPLGIGKPVPAAPPLKSPVVTPSPSPPPPVYKQPPPPTPVSPPPPPSPSSPPPPLPTPPPPPRPKTTKDCFLLCQVRCKLHSRMNVCLRACVTCCDRCKCVPPGQSGNRNKCGKCYTNMTTHGGRPKCP